MKKDSFIQQVLQGTKILRPPRHTLATFGTTTLHYVMLSEISDAGHQCRLRQGCVTAERPRILTPDLWKKRFEGFGEDVEEYKGLMDQLYGEAYRGLEYTFKNDLERTSLEKSSLTEVAQRTLGVMEHENSPRTALLQGPDRLWAFSVMKFIVEISMRSFPDNVRELDERGFFEPEKRAEARDRHRIESLFKQALHDPDALKKLSETLKETGLFADYEDRFFNLVKNV